MGLIYHMLSRWMTLFIPATCFVIAAFVKWHQPLTIPNYFGMMLLLYFIFTIFELLTTTVCKSRLETEEVSFQTGYFIGLCVVFTLLIVLRT